LCTKDLGLGIGDAGISISVKNKKQNILLSGLTDTFLPETAPRNLEPHLSCFPSNWHKPGTEKNPSNSPHVPRGISSHYLRQFSCNWSNPPTHSGRSRLPSFSFYWWENWSPCRLRKLPGNT
jgi:hypothetical protein